MGSSQQILSQYALDETLDLGGKPVYPGFIDELFPDKPVLLTRIDGHAALANQKALNLGGITARTESFTGFCWRNKGILTYFNHIKKIS